MSTTPTPIPVLPAVPDETLRELLCAYFVARDELYEAEAEQHPTNSEISRQAVIDIADELVACFVPDATARCALTGETPTDLAYHGPAQPAAGQPIAAIQPGVGRISGTITAVTERGVIVTWNHTNLLPITYPRSQVVPTATGWHIRRS